MGIADGVRADPDVAIGRRHRKPADALQGRRVAHDRARGIQVTEAGAGAPAPEAGIAVADIAQAGVGGGTLGFDGRVRRHAPEHPGAAVNAAQ